MNTASVFRSSTLVLGLLIGAAASCSSGSADDAPAAGTNPGGGANLAGAAQVGGGSGGAPVGAGGATACPGVAPNSISDLEQPAQYAYWSKSNDATPGAVQTPAGAFVAEMLPDGHYGVHTTGSGFTNWGAGVAVNLAAAKKCFDLTKYTGVKFRAKGPATLTVAAQVPGVVPTTSGGTCADNCYDSHKATVNVGAEWAEYTIPWTQFKQAGWGTPAEFAGSAVNLLDFQAGPGVTFDFWVDEVAFSDAPPTMGTGGATGGGGATGSAGSTSGNGGSAGSVVSTHKFEDVLSEAQFNQMFPQRNQFYSYQGLAAAAKVYSLFAAVGDATTQKREVAAFLANVARETGNLKFIDELNPQGIYCQATNTQYPCAPGQDYHGRGPIQLSWNYNYGAAGKAIGENLLANPSLVSTNATIAWETGLWFWMTAMANGRTPHTVMVQNAGFGLTINVINGNLECNGKNPEAVNQRVNAFKNFCQLLGVDPGPNLTC